MIIRIMAFRICVSEGVNYIFRVNETLNGWRGRHIGFQRDRLLRAAAVDIARKFSHLHVIARIPTVKFSKAILINDSTASRDFLTRSRRTRNAFSTFTSDYREKARHAGG